MRGRTNARNAGAKTQDEPGLLMASQGCGSKPGLPAPDILLNETITQCVFKPLLPGFCRERESADTQSRAKGPKAMQDEHLEST